MPQTRSLVNSLENFVATLPTLPLAPSDISDMKESPGACAWPLVPEIPPLVSEIDTASPSTFLSSLPPPPPSRQEEVDMMIATAATDVATKQIKSHFNVLRSELDQRERELLQCVQHREGRRRDRSVAFLNSIRNIIAKVTDTLCHI